MPAFYAHDRFGKVVAGRMEGELKGIIKKYYRQFRIGLQGLDIFFFYKAYGTNEVNKYGNHLHSISAYPFFEHAEGVVRRKGIRSPEYAYLMGFICHFILDSECHPYVEKMMETTGVGHLEIEEEFEKMLLRTDGKDALAFPYARYVPTDQETAEAIAPFFDEVDAKTVRSSLRWLRIIKKLFTAPGKGKQNFLNAAMDLMGKTDYYKGLMNQRIDNPACRESNEGLLEHFDEAVGWAVKMILSFDKSMRSGEKLDVRFERTFE